MMYKEIEAVLDEHVRPYLHSHMGEIEVLDFSDGIVRFKLKGHCAGCPAADLTAEELIQTALVAHAAGVRQAVLVQEISDDLLQQARDIMKLRHGG